MTPVGPAAQGGDTVLDLTDPSESARASSVKVTVFFDTPLASVNPQPLAGWRITTKQVNLPTPITTDDGKISVGVGQVTWTAVGSGPSAGVPPEQFQQFFVAAGPLPTTPTMTFRAIQTYSNGNVVKWIETRAPGATEPERPAPVLDLPPATSGPSQIPTTVATSTTSSSDSVGRGLAIAALVVAVIAAVLAGRGLLRRE